MKNAFRGMVQRYGTETIRKRLWDIEYDSGQWDCLEEMAGDCLYPYIEKYAMGGRILDLGCGPGATGNELQSESYSFYTGVDISSVAIRKAKKRTEKNGRSSKNEYFQSDVCTYKPQGIYDVIVFGDSIYYVPLCKIGPMLNRYSSSLSLHGVFIVRIKGVRPEWWGSATTETLSLRSVSLVNHESGSWARRRSILASIEKQFSVIEKQLHYFSDVICVIVFRPQVRARRLAAI